MGTTWGKFVTFRAILGTSEGHLGWICAIRGRFGVIWAILGEFVTFGAVLRSFWDIGAIWGTFQGHLGAILGLFGVEL